MSPAIASQCAVCVYVLFVRVCFFVADEYEHRNYDSNAYQLLVCIALRLFNKIFAASFHKAQSATMNDLVGALCGPRPPFINTHTPT